VLYDFLDVVIPFSSTWDEITQRVRTYEAAAYTISWVQLKG